MPGVRTSLQSIQIQPRAQESLTRDGPNQVTGETTQLLPKV